MCFVDPMVFAGCSRCPALAFVRARVHCGPRRRCVYVCVCVCAGDWALASALALANSTQPRSARVDTPSVHMVAHMRSALCVCVGAPRPERERRMWRANQTIYITCTGSALAAAAHTQSNRELLGLTHARAATCVLLVLAHAVWIKSVFYALYPTERRHTHTHTRERAKKNASYT